MSSSAHPEEWIMSKPRRRHRGRVAEPTRTLSAPPRLVFDAQGQVGEVILDYGGYLRLLRILARHADWEALPPYLQDAVDNLFADDALAEKARLLPSPRPSTSPGTCRADVLLTGRRNRWRLRAGDDRILRIAHRRDVYR
jgi:hypothetical protein